MSSPTQPTHTTPIPWRNIRALSFDIFGTLVDWPTGVVDTLRASVLGPHLPAARADVLAQFRAVQQPLFALHPTMLARELDAEVVRQYARRLSVVAAGEVSEARVEEAAVGFGRELGTRGAAFPDTVAAMQRLGRFYKLVCISNTDHVAWAATSSGPLAGIEWAAAYTSQDIGAFKPSPKMSEYLLEHNQQNFGIGKEQLCMVAQGLASDHSPCKDFGIFSVFVDRQGVHGKGVNREGNEEFGYQLRVQTLAELADIVEEAWR